MHKSDTRDQPGVSSHGDRPRCHPRHRHGAEDGTHGNESSWAGKKSPTSCSKESTVLETS